MFVLATAVVATFMMKGVIEAGPPGPMGPKAHKPTIAKPFKTFQEVQKKVEALCKANDGANWAHYHPRTKDWWCHYELNEGGFDEFKIYPKRYNP